MMRRCLFLSLLGSFLVSSAALAGPTVCAAGTTTPGIDVSKWQGAIDWTQVAGSQQFVIARVSDGTYLDTWFDSYWPDIKANGMVRGAYQYFEPAEDPIAQADILLNKMGPMEAGMLPPTLDVEATGGLTPAEVEAAVQQWVDYVQAKLGVAPIVYTGNWFWDPSVNSAAQAGLPLWESYYCTNCCPKIPAPWTDWVIWQYDDKGTVAGVSGDCDMNLWNGDLASLQTFAGGGSGPANTCGNGTCDAAEDCSACPGDCPCASGESCQAGVCAAPNCPGYTGTDPCCTTANACGYGSDGYCDCGGFCTWEASDCTAAPVCGDGTCNGTEDCTTCATDCGACSDVCGDGTCGSAETCSSCPTDCGPCAGYCGDGTCGSGETCGNCATDCGPCVKDAGGLDVFQFDAGGGPSGCTADAQCPNVCNVATGQCVQCNANWDCIGGGTCTANHTCVSVCGDGQCAGDESNQTCCVDCPCSTGLQCVNGACVGGAGCSDTCVKLYSSACVGSASYHTCQKAGGGCLGWDPDKNCASGLVCYLGKCMTQSSVPDAGPTDVGETDVGGPSDTGSGKDGGGGKDALADGSAAIDVVADAGAIGDGADSTGISGDGSKSDVKYFGGGGVASSGCTAGRREGSGGWLLGALCAGALLVRRRGRAHHT